MASKILDMLKTKGWGPSRLAKALKIKPQAVSQWDEVPPRRVFEVADITGLEPEILCPSIATKKGRAA